MCVCVCVFVCVCVLGVHIKNPNKDPRFLKDLRAQCFRLYVSELDNCSSTLYTLKGDTP